ncbi:MAG: hypothetical protein IH932_02900 [Thaumarchaeota archaeon]|nr:hypothetical protein [Nitrososphaerota archaeon]
MSKCVWTGLEEDMLHSCEDYLELYLTDSEEEILDVQPEEIDLEESLDLDEETEALISLIEKEREAIKYRRLFDVDDIEAEYVPVSQDYDDGYELEIEVDLDEDQFDPEENMAQKDAVIYFLQVKTNPKFLAMYIYDPSDEEDYGARGLYQRALNESLS